jgi:hypothetical protein
MRALQPPRRWLAALVARLPTGRRRLGLAHPTPARATCATIRLELLEMGAAPTESIARTWMGMSAVRRGADGCRRVQARAWA